MRLRRIASLAALLLACSTGCDAGDNPKPAAPAGAAPAAAAKPAPNVAGGRVLGPDGKPISVKGAKYLLNLNGTTAGGKNAYLVPVVAADGTWKAELVAGKYHRPTGRITVPYEDTAITYALAPTAPEGDFDAADGLACDLIWKIEGAKPDVAKPNPDNATHYYGGKIGVAFDQFPRGGKPVVDVGQLGPQGTVVRFTARPVGKRIDGSDAGAARTFDLAYDTTNVGVRPSALHDLPVGRYAVSAVMSAPGGGGGGAAAKAAGAPLLVRQSNETEYRDAVEVTFLGYAATGELTGPTVHFTRRP